MTATDASSEASERNRRAERTRQAASAGLAFASVVLVSAADGGYFPVTWGWATLALLLVAASALILADRVELGILEASWLALAALLVLWMLLSSAWSDSLPRSTLEAQRSLLYVSALGAVFAVVRRPDATAVFAGVLGAISAIAAYALATRLLPDQFGYVGADPYVLARPLGYSNALGVFVAIGALLAVGFAAHARTGIARALGAALPPMLLTTLFFTDSRGAWIALAVGALGAIALSSQRLWLGANFLLVALPAAMAIWLASRFDGLADRASLAATVSSGRRFVALLAALTVVSALLPMLAERFAASFRGGRRVRHAIGMAAGGAAVAVALIALARPASLVGPVTEAFRTPVVPGGEDLDDRLLSFSGNGRSEYWRVAWSQYTSHPTLGSGAGTYEIYWTQNRPNAFGARDAHNLYLETLAELGPVGLVLLLAFLATPLVAFVAVRPSGLPAVALGGYAAYLVHAGIDWDWEVPGVTLPALFCGAGVVLAVGAGRVWTLSRSARIGAFAVVALLIATASVTAIGNGALAASERAAAADRPAEAEADARKATRWAPWSSEAWLAVAHAQLAQGRRSAARASLENGLDLDPRDWRLWHQLALVTEGPERDAALAEVARLNPLRR